MRDFDRPAPCETSTRTCASRAFSDDEARSLPTPLDGLRLSTMDISTWRTDAGDLDILTALPTRDGGRATYEQLVARAAHVDLAGVGVLVASLDDIIASKEWLIDRRIEMRSWG